MKTFASTGKFSGSLNGGCEPSQMQMAALTITCSYPPTISMLVFTLFALDELR